MSIADELYHDFGPDFAAEIARIATIVSKGSRIEARIVFYTKYEDEIRVHLNRGDPKCGGPEEWANRDEYLLEQGWKQRADSLWYNPWDADEEGAEEPKGIMSLVPADDLAWMDYRDRPWYERFWLRLRGKAPTRPEPELPRVGRRTYGR